MSRSRNGTTTRVRKAFAVGGAALLAAAVLAACGESQEAGSPAAEEAGSPATEGAVPLADALDTMEPQAVWQNFYDLTQVPRPSHHEEQATQFVADFGRGLGLDTTVDDAGNVVIGKPASAGMEQRPTVVLQAHLDMVPQKTPASKTNFETDPIDALVEDGWVRADGTTLGADDGIGVAIIMSILEADDLSHGPLEALFTVNEEDGMSGIHALAPDALDGRMYLNVDNEVEGEFVISSAGAVTVETADSYREVAAPSDATGFVVTVDGLLGGHSGIDIDKGRASAHELMARLLLDSTADVDARVADLVGGEVPNVIPSFATATLAVPAPQAEVFQKAVEDFEASVQKEYAETDPDVTVTAKSAASPDKVMEAGAQQALLGAVGDVPQGVYAMSDDIPGMVETSNNLGVLTIQGGEFTGVALARSADNAERDAEGRRVADVFGSAGATVELTNPYSAWPPDPDSPLLALMQRTYKDLFGSEAKVEATHAGLEASTAQSTFPGMDIVSVGPTLENVHSTDERLEVDTVPNAYDLIVATLEAVE